MAQFDGKAVIVIGAASGIGEGTARWFSATGATLMLGEESSRPEITS